MPQKTTALKKKLHWPDELEGVIQGTIHSAQTCILEQELHVKQHRQITQSNSQFSLPHSLTATKQRKVPIV